MPSTLALLAVLGSALAMVATYWDDSWHTDKGRDDFAIPPHLMLYGGVLLASLAVAAWGLLAWRSAGWGLRGVRAVLRDPALLLAGVGGVTTLASAPVDNAWHAAYGRDAVLWSPPHLIAVAGTLALSVGILAGLRRADSRAGSIARLCAAAGVIGALQVPVLEYDSDVPQFSTLWFLPVAALGLCVAVALLDDLLPGRWAPAQAALVYTGLRIVTVGLLAALGFSLTVVPPLALVLLVSCAMAARPLAQRLVLLGALSPLVWWPFLELQADVTTTVPLERLPASILLGAGAGLLVALAHGDLRPGRPMVRTAQAAAVLAVVGVALGAPTERAEAHDPGQGQQVLEGPLVVERTDDKAQLTMTLSGGCDALEPVRTAARRAGETLTGALEAAATSDGDCAVTGTVTGLGAGRWFVYAELHDSDGRDLEAWLPAEEDAVVSEIRPLYEPPASSSPTAQRVVGGVLLFIVGSLLVGCLRLSRRSAPVPGQPSAAA
jgi:hypothetical protein